MTPHELAQQWPAIEEQLQVADVLLFHKRTGAITTRIQRHTGSHWSHVALVFMPKTDMPFGGPLIVEASFGGIEIHQLKKYTDKFNKYDIGAMRFPGLTDEQKEKLILNFILKNIDVHYDYSRLFGLFFKKILTKIHPKLYVAVARRAIHEESFVCSTFVYQSFQSMYKGGAIQTPKAVPYGEPKLREANTYTPAQIANLHYLIWMFNKRK